MIELIFVLVFAIVGYYTFITIKVIDNEKLRNKILYGKTDNDKEIEKKKQKQKSQELMGIKNSRQK